MSDLSRALAQIEAIHEHMSRGEVYRGWRPVPVAASGVVGLAAAAWQASADRPLEPWSFAIYWLAIAGVGLIVGCSEIAWHYVARAGGRDRRQSLLVLSQFLPALVAGALVTGALIKLSPALVALLPGLWALLFGVAVFAARPYVPPGSAWVALYFWSAGMFLLWTADGVDALSPWSVGGTFGIGQLLGAAVLRVTADRPPRMEMQDP